MKIDKFFKEIPYPFRVQEEMKFKEKLLSSLPKRDYDFIPKLVFVFSVILLVLLIPFLINNKVPNNAETKRIIVLNPLKIKSEELVLKDFHFFIPEYKEERIEDIPFRIAKTDHLVKLEWQADGVEKYRIKKCTFPPKKGCSYVEETNKNYFIDKPKEEEKLVFYIVEAVRS